MKREFAGKIAQRPVIASAHINYIYGGIYIMLKIRYMGYNNTHPDGINMERPGGMGHYAKVLDQTILRDMQEVEKQINNLHI